MGAYSLDRNGMFNTTGSSALGVSLLPVHTTQSNLRYNIKLRGRAIAFSSNEIINSEFNGIGAAPYTFMAVISIQFHKI